MDRSRCELSNPVSIDKKVVLCSEICQGYSLGRFGRLGVKSAALVQFGEFVDRDLAEMFIEMSFFSAVDSAFEVC